MKLKPYPKYKDSGIQWIGKIPEGWGVSRVKHICSKSAEYGLNVPSDNYVDEGVRFLRTTDITKNERLIENGVYLPENRVNKEYLLDTGDVLVARSGSIGTSLYFDKRKYGKCSFAGYLVRFVVNNLNNGRFLYYFTKSKSFYAQIESQSIQTTIENFNGQKYANMQISVPPLLDQTTIASFLDKKTSEINKTIEKDKKLIALLKEKRTALINHAVTKGLDPNVKMKDSGIEWIGEIPEGWEVRKLKHIASIRVSNVDKKSKPNEEEVLLCNYNEVYNNEAITSDLNFMKATANIDQINKFSIKKEDVIITKDSETPDDIAVPSLVKEELSDVVCGYHLALIRANKSKVKGKFLLRLLQSRKINDQFVISANGVTRFGISTYPIKNSFVITPPLPEQTAIANFLDKATSKIDKTIELIESKIELLEEYKKSLIHHVVTGKVDVRKVEA